MKISLFQAQLLVYGLNTLLQGAEVKRLNIYNKTGSAYCQHECKLNKSNGATQISQ
jgi:hypothetical protein